MVDLDTRAHGAVLSADGRYRYALVRRFDLSAPDAMVWLMLNPSTADASSDDPTIRKCVGFAARHGFGAIIVVNLYAFRATNPADLIDARARGIDVVGPENDEHIRAAVAGRVLVEAWGATKVPAIDERIAVVRALCVGARERCCFGFSKGPPAQPRHPLMLPYTAAREPVPAPFIGGNRDC